MPKINRLPKSIYELIAAGEVVEDRLRLSKSLLKIQSTQAQKTLRSKYKTAESSTYV